MTITTGIRSLDDLLGGGLTPGSLTLYAGISQAGMTTLLDTTVCAAALQSGVPTLLADLESGGRNLRLLSTHSGVDLLALQRAELTEQDEVRLAASQDAVKEAPLHTSTSRRSGYLLADAMDSKAELIAIDGARYIQVSGADESTDVPAFASLKSMAVDLNAAVVVTGPINRDHMQGPGPTLSNLPAGIEQICDTVVLIHRIFSAWAERTNRDDAELIVAKNRFGRTGRVSVLGDFGRAKFHDGETHTSKAA